MSTFEKQSFPPAGFATSDKIIIWFCCLVIVVGTFVHVMRPADSTTITIPPPPSNYAVLATDGKGHLFWEEPVQFNPLGNK